MRQKYNLREIPTRFCVRKKRQDLIFDRFIAVREVDRGIFIFGEHRAVMDQWITVASRAPVWLKTLAVTPIFFISDMIIS